MYTTGEGASKGVGDSRDLFRADGDNVKYT